MSLIHDALRGAGESSPAVDTHPARNGTWPRLPRHGMWLLLGVVLAGPTGYLIARSGGGQQAVQQAVSAPPSAQHVVEPAASDAAPDVAFASTTTASPTSTPAPVVAMLPPIVLAKRESTVAPPAAAATVAPAASANTGSTAASRPEAARTAPPQLQISVSEAPAAQKSVAKAATPTAGDEPDPAQVRTAMSRLQAAVAGGDIAVRDASLDELQKLLPADSLTLLRARAWAAHGGNDIEGAERYYRAILQRVPDDEYAGVNLALIDARRGDVNEARERLARLAARNSGSQMVSRAQAELETVRQ
ncbi:MAG: tetratricopeptide repeat protein [Stenotrophomonas sp.]